MARNHHTKTKPIEPVFYYGESENEVIEVLSFDNDSIPLKVRELRWKLNQKAVKEPEFRFYSLYNQICRADVIETAWKNVGKRGKAAGIDGVCAEEFLDNPVKLGEFLTGIREALTNKTYRADPVLRVYIPKANKGKRPLGIPTLKDRVVQAATLLIMEPIFEADFLECSHGFRPGKKAHEALEKIQETIKSGRTEIYDADLKSYFDTIPHDKLMKCVKMRVVDSSILKLIESWLKAPIIEKTDDNKRLPPKANRQGVQQGGVISPLLSNLYLHWLDKKFHMKTGPFKWANARLIRYADDFVVCANHISQKLIDWVKQTVEEWLGLTLNPDKTQILSLKKESRLEFLGYTFRYDRSLFGYKGKYLNVIPAKKSIVKARQEIHRLTASNLCRLPVESVVDRLNTFLRGWKNYFSYGYCKKAYAQINFYAGGRMLQHLQRKSQRGYKKDDKSSHYALVRNTGLLYL